MGEAHAVASVLFSNIYLLQDCDCRTGTCSSRILLHRHLRIQVLMTSFFHELMLNDFSFVASDSPSNAVPKSRSRVSATAAQPRATHTYTVPCVRTPCTPSGWATRSRSNSAPSGGALSSRSSSIWSTVRSCQSVFCMSALVSLCLDVLF